MGNSTNDDTTKETARTGLRVCLRLRLLRLLFRLFMLRASGMSNQELRQTTAAAVKALTGSSDQVHQNIEASSDADLCRILCGLGACPPGCPDENKPPWGKKRWKRDCVIFCSISMELILNLTYIMFWENGKLFTFLDIFCFTLVLQNIRLWHTAATSCTEVWLHSWRAATSGDY